MKRLRNNLLFFMCIMFIVGISQDGGYIQKYENLDYININNTLYNDSDSIEIDVDYTHGWDNPSINCYKDIEIPLTAKIDVSGFIYPVNSNRITSEFGYRSRFGRMHYGIDLGLKTGDTVRSTFDGIVRIVNFEMYGYGKYIVIRHSNGVETVYAHLSKQLVERNQIIQAGQPIGLGGNTGRSTNPHLHYEIRYFGLALNPSSIIDFKKGVILQDVYIFDKKSYRR